MPQLTGAGAAPSVGVLAPPHGLNELIATFGDIFKIYIREDHTLDSRWQTDCLTTVPLPFALTLSWDGSRPVQRISVMSCWRAPVRMFLRTFRARDCSITIFGECFSFRPQPTGTKLSTHAWGIALDLNPESNAQGTAGNMDAGVVAIFKQAGFSWGGDWPGACAIPYIFNFVRDIRTLSPPSTPRKKKKDHM